MRQLLAGKLISRIQESFLRRLELVGPYLKEIRTHWRRLLERLALGRAESQVLAGLEIEKFYEYLRAGDFHAYELALERQGQILASRDVPEEYSVAALGFLYESCLPYILGEDPRDKEHAVTLAQLIGAGQLSLISGYANHRAASWWTLEEKLRRAEQHVQALATHVTEAYEQERRKLSRDLHDEIGHDLALLKLYLEMLAADVQKDKMQDIPEKLDEAVSLINKAIEAVRRIAFDLGPGIFDEMGFAPAIKFYARRFSMRTGVKVRVGVSPSLPIPPPRIKMAFYRVLQGAFSNVLKHSRAKQVKVHLKGADHSIFMAVEDDGSGFSVQRKLRDPRKTFGLLAMRERVELLEGSFRILSPAGRSGRRRYGTRVEVLLPVPEEETTR